jgi:hypothetical protein
MGNMQKIFGAAAVLLTAAVVCRQWPVFAAETLDRPGQASAAAERIREGTNISEKSGQFQPTGDRLMFYLADTGQRLGTLENLNLERVAKMVGDSPEPLEWNVSGMVTEFQGVNYLLVERAVLKTKLQRRSAGQK